MVWHLTFYLQVKKRQIWEIITSASTGNILLMPFYRAFVGGGGGNRRPEKESNP